MVEFKSVYSSAVSKIGYDPETSELHVIWARGKHSVYSGVPEKVANSVMNAASIGIALHDVIIPEYGHTYVR